jgi:hypothetical protein
VAELSLSYIAFYGAETWLTNEKVYPEAAAGRSKHHLQLHFSLVDPWSYIVVELAVNVRSPAGKMIRELQQPRNDLADIDRCKNRIRAATSSRRQQYLGLNPDLELSNGYTTGEWRVAFTRSDSLPITWLSKKEGGPGSPPNSACVDAALASQISMFFFIASD